MCVCIPVDTADNGPHQGPVACPFLPLVGAVVRGVYRDTHAHTIHHVQCLSITLLCTALYFSSGSWTQKQRHKDRESSQRVMPTLAQPLNFFEAGVLVDASISAALHRLTEYDGVLVHVPVLQRLQKPPELPIKHCQRAS